MGILADSMILSDMKPIEKGLFTTDSGMPLMFLYVLERL